jgi:hypothetical protein
MHHLIQLLEAKKEKSSCLTSTGANQLARLDTGVEEIFFTTQPQWNKVATMEETPIVFGNGEETHIGDLEAIVCNENQLIDDLAAIHFVVDAGYNIHLCSQGGTMNKPSFGHSVPFLRDVEKWLVDLEELKHIKIKGKPIIVIMLVTQVMCYDCMSVWSVLQWRHMAK